MKTNPEQIAVQWVETFNRHDAAALAALYAADAVHLSPKLRVQRPETEGRLVGREALQRWWQDAFDRIPSLHYELMAVAIGEGCVFIEYLRRADGEAPLRVAEIFELDEDKIRASRVYHG